MMENVQKKKILLRSIKYLLIFIITMIISTANNNVSAWQSWGLAESGGSNELIVRIPSGLYYYAWDREGNSPYDNGPYMRHDFSVYAGETMYLFGKKAHGAGGVYWHHGAPAGRSSVNMIYTGTFKTYNANSPLTSIRFDAPGVYTVGLDPYTNLITWDSVCFQITVLPVPDTTPPSVWFGAQPGWSNSSCTLYWDGADTQSGIARYEGSHDCYTTYDMGLATYYTWYGAVDNVPYYIRAVDNVGNYSGWAGPLYIRVDTTAPTIGSFKQSNAYTNASWGSTYRVYMNLPSDTGGAGFARQYIYLSKTNTWDAWDVENADTYSDGSQYYYDVPITTEGTYLIHTNGHDNVWNYGSGYNRTLIVDRTAPTISNYTLSSAYSNGGNITASLNASDSVGVASVKFYAWTGSGSYRTEKITSTVGPDGRYQATFSPTEIVNAASNTATGQNGTYYIDAWAFDTIGNSVYQSSLSFIYDTTPPTTGTFKQSDLKINKQSGSTQRVYMNLPSDEGGSGLAKQYIYVSRTNTWGDWVVADKEAHSDGSQLYYDVPITTEGKYLIHTSCYDNAGNYGSGYNITLVVDRSAPRVEEIKINGKTTSDNATTDTPTVLVDIKFEESDCKKYVYISNSGGLNPETISDWVEYSNGIIHVLNDSDGDGLKTIYVYVKDDFGNMAAAVQEDDLDLLPKITLTSRYISQRTRTNIKFRVLDENFDTATSDFKYVSDLKLYVDGTLSNNAEIVSVSKGNEEISRNSKTGREYTAVISNIQGNGTLKLSVDGESITDKAKNKINNAIMDTDIIVDNNPPKISTTKNGNKLTISIEDANRFNGVFMINNQVKNMLDKNTITIDTTVGTSYTIKVIDMCGNSSTKSITM